MKQCYCGVGDMALECPTLSIAFDRFRMNSRLPLGSAMETMGSSGGAIGMPVRERQRRRAEFSTINTDGARTKLKKLTF